MLELRLRRAEWGNPFPQLVGSAVCDAPQDTVALPGCRGTLMFSLASECKKPFQWDSSPLCQPPVCMHTPSQVQNLARALVKLHVVGDCSIICLDLSMWPLHPWWSQQLLPA